MRSLLRIVVIGLSALICNAAAAQSPTASDKTAIEALLQKYVSYLNSGNSDAISKEIYSAPILVTLDGGKHLAVNSTADIAAGWKAFLDAGAKKGFKSTEAKSFDIALLGPDTATASVGYANVYAARDTPVMTKYLYLLQKANDEWRLIAVLKQDL